jgi:hypothetical protein
MIDHHKIIDLLSDRLRIEIKTAGNDFQDLLEHLHRNLKEHGQAVFPGLGTFHLDEGNVTFEPDAQLVIDINFRYHGMQPIVLESTNGLFRHDDNDERAIPETTVFVIDEPLVPSNNEDNSNLTEPLTSVNHGESFPETTIEIPQELEIGADQLEHSLVPDVVDSENKARASILAKDRTLKTPPLSRQSPHTIPIDIKIDNDYVHKGQRWRSFVGVVVFSLILMAGAATSWYNGWLEGAGVPGFHEVFPNYATRNDPGSITSESPTIEQEQSQAQSEEQNLESTLEQGLINEVEETVAGNPVVGTYGLDGAWLQDLETFHTIVSATMFTETVANEIIEEVTTANMRARLFRVRVRGEVAWELHLGQFESREAASAANLTLDRKFQSEVIRQYGQQ